MRTTLTLDEDIAAKLQSEARKTGKPFKLIVNEMLREGFLAKRTKKALPPFKVKTRPLGLRPGLSYDCIGKLLEELEGPLHR
jgi:hypothetical protein